MKNTYIIIIILVLAVLGFMVFGKSNKLEAPIVEENADESGTITNTMPVVTGDLEVEEKVVVGVLKEFTVSGNNFSFTPSTIKVKKGDKVKITFKNVNGFHDFKIDEYGVATKKDSAPFEEVLEFTADKAGSFEYYCSVGEHRAMGMKGTLVVE